MTNKKAKRLTETSYLILLATMQPTHSYGIITHIRDKTDHHIQIGPGTLYGALAKMVKAEWISMNVIDDKKIYQITTLGKQIIRAEIARLDYLTNLGRQLYKT